MPRGKQALPAAAEGTPSPQRDAFGWTSRGSGELRWISNGALTSGKKEKKKKNTENIETMVLLCNTAYTSLKKNNKKNNWQIFLHLVFVFLKKYLKMKQITAWWCHDGCMTTKVNFFSAFFSPYLRTTFFPFLQNIYFFYSFFKFFYWPYWWSPMVTKSALWLSNIQDERCTDELCFTETDCFFP